jgi:hypothetical protein
MRRARWCVALAGCLLAACDDGVLRAFEPRALALAGGGADPGPNAEAGGGRGGTPSIDPVAGTGNARPTSPLLIDNFEDGDSRAEEPLGWWYPINDKTSTTQGFGIEPLIRDTVSFYALRTHGSGFQDWGAAVGVNLEGDSTPLSALGYESLCFVARVEAGTGDPIDVHLVRVEVEDVHYVQGVSLSETWSRHCLPLVDFIGPNDAALVPNELIALQFFLPPRSPFVLWLDDVSLVP